MMKTMSNNEKHWALLNRQGFDGIIEYLEHAVVKFPQKEEMNKYELAEHLKIHAHLFVCIKTLLLHCDPEYRERVEPTLHRSSDGDDNFHIY